jgi:hypothetical protein
MLIKLRLAQITYVPTNSALCKLQTNFWQIGALATPLYALQHMVFAGSTIRPMLIIVMVGQW